MNSIFKSVLPRREVSRVLIIFITRFSVGILALWFYPTARSWWLVASLVVMGLLNQAWKFYPRQKAGLHGSSWNT